MGEKGNDLDHGLAAVAAATTGGMTSDPSMIERVTTTTTQTTTPPKVTRALVPRTMRPAARALDAPMTSTSNAASLPFSEATFSPS